MPATALVTSEQYLALPDQFDQYGNRIKDELIGGEIVRMPPSSLYHDRIKNLIGRILARYLDANPKLALEVLVETGAQVSHYDTFVPDIGIVKIERLSGEARILQGAPELAIEVVSPSDRTGKTRTKIAAYLQGGSRAVWIVSPEQKTIAIHLLGSVRDLTGDQHIEDPLLPGFSVPVSAFFELS